MADVSIAILGLGRVGTSIGLALKRYNRGGGAHRFFITGYDSRAASVKAAQKLGAVDEVTSQPEAAARGKDIVVIALPYSEVEQTYRFAGGSLRAGAVLIDLSPLIAPSVAWAAKTLPKDAHLICAHAAVNPNYLMDGVDATDRASEDYFDDGTLFLMPGITSAKEAIDLASELTRILGARVQFIDPAEHDSLAAMTDLLPMLVGVAYFHMIQRSSGWPDLQRLTNGGFGMLTHNLFDTHPDDLRELWLRSGADLTRALDELIASLRTLRGVIAGADRDGLEAALDVSSREYEGWINRRRANRWDEDPSAAPRQISFGSMMGNMVGSVFVGGRRKDHNNNS
jgi:prephenate dehydrogenase